MNQPSHDTVRVLLYSESISLFHVSLLVKVAEVLRESYSNIQMALACSRQFHELVQRKGFPTLPIETDAPEAIYGRLRRFEPMYNAEILQRYLQEDLAVIDDFGADLLIQNMRVTVPIVAQHRKLPCISVISGMYTPYFCGRRSAPFHLFEKRPYLRRLISGLYHSPLGRMLERDKIRKNSEPIRNVAKTLGVEPLPSMLDYLSFGQAVLIPDIPELIPLRNPPGHYYQTGPLLWTFPAPLPPEVERVEKGFRTIYFTTGTSAFPEHIVVESVDALLKAGYRVIVTKAGRDLRFPFDHPHLHVYDYLSNLDVLSRVDLLISHGGIATTYEALLNAVPIVGIPSFYDQQWHMDALVDQGVGRILFPYELTASGLLQAVESIFSDPECFANAARLQQVLRSQNPGDIIRRAVEELPLQQGGKLCLKRAGES